MLQNARFYKGIIWFVILETLFYLFYTLPWAFVFNLFINSTDPSRCHNPMWWWCNFTNWFFWIASIWNVVSIPIRYILLSKEIRNQPSSQFTNLIEGTKVLQVIGCVLCSVMLARAYERQGTCMYLAPLVKFFLLSNIVSLVIWCSGTYFLYVRLWKKAVDWVIEKESQNELKNFPNNSQDEKESLPPIENDYSKINKINDDEVPLLSEESEDKIEENGTKNELSTIDIAIKENI